MRGHLVLADISGYTRFLTDSELEHANGIINELLNAVIKAIQAPLEVSSIEGDAVFMYGTVPETITGQTTLESVELLYCSFASALETMVVNTTCTCNACANIKDLGMKIVMHCGEYVISELAGRETLSGPDVITAHRLLKNHVREETGVADYMLVTQACVDDLGVQDMVAGWIEHTERYEDVGEIAGYVSSLPDVWAFVRQQNEDKVVQRDSWITVSAHSKAAPTIVWDHLIDPIKRTAWLGADENTVQGVLNGRIGVGTEYHCAHGEGQVQPFTVLDMRPVDYVTFLTLPAEGVSMRYTDYVIPSGTGTRIVSYVAPLFSTESGVAFPEETLEAQAKPATDLYGEALSRLAAMSEKAAASVSLA